MERINSCYSVKNIPLTNERTYKLQLIEKIESVIKRIRWKATFFDARNEGERNEEVTEKIETYGLKRINCPKQIPELNLFESDLIKLAQNIKFRKTTNKFQKQMGQDIANIRKSYKTLTPAYKTSNMYRSTKEEYNKLKDNAVTSTYKKASVNIKERVDKYGIKFAKDAGVFERIRMLMVPTIAPLL